MRGIGRQLWLALLLSCGIGSAQAQVVISQVYGGGGNSGATFTNDYVELFNRGADPVALSGKSIQYASATGTGNFGAGSSQLLALPGDTIEPGGYYLVALAGGSTGVPLPAADASGTINMAGASGKAALVDSTSSLGCNGGSNPCTPAQEALILDLVGFGGANYFEGDGAAPGLNNSTAGFRADAGCTDSDDNAADFGTGTPAPRNSSTVPNICGGGGEIYLSIADTSAAEGDAGTTPFFFTISLNQPAGAGGVSVDYATADASAVAGEDYASASGTVQIDEGQSSVTVTVDVTGDAVTEPDETFLVVLDNAGGALIARAEATGTILNDDIETLAIHQIQGSGQLSPYDGQAVATEGIVTGRKNNGFFLQGADGEDDGDPATSEGVFVFTGGAPPDAAAVGNRVLVQGTVDEYVPAADPHQLPLTEIVSPTVVQLSSGHAMPAPVALTVDTPNADGGLEQLEHLEGMRVTAPAFTVVAPTGGFTNEPSATGNSNGRFAVVVTGTARPFREPGIQVPDPDPSGSTATDIPRWDFNPELIAVNSTTIGAPAADVAAGCQIVDGSLTGPLDYTFRRYTIYPEGELAVECGQAGQPRAAQLPAPDHATFATYNLERFFDTENDPATGEPVLTPEALERRLGKASLGIRQFLHAPDVLGVTEVENLPVLQALAERINADAVGAGQPDPGYVAWLEEGNDVGGIDVGFLARTGEVGAGVPRVEVLTVEQVGADAMLDNPDGSTTLLNDRPPLVMDAVVHFADGRSFPVTAIVVHQRSLSGIDSEDPGSSGWATGGQRVRAKRQAQAEYLAGVIDGMQEGDPARNIVVLGDFNAFQFNDGYVDALGVVTGQPSPDDETAVNGDGADLVEPDLRNTTLDAPADERYSFVFDYQAQALDHVLVNQAILASPELDGHSISHARINADFPEVARNDPATPTRLSDHDPTVLLVRLGALSFADLAVMAEAIESSVVVGGALEYAVTVSNDGPDQALFPGVGFSLDAQLGDLAVSAPAGWSCDAPTSGSDSTSVACTADALDAGAEAVFGLSATAPESTVGASVALAAAATSQTSDPDEGDNDASASIEVTEQPPEVPELQNGVAVTGLEGAAGEAHLYRIEVPEGARNLRVLSYGGSGDVTLFLRHGEPPTADEYDARSARPGNNEVVHVGAPAAGTWYVRLVGERAHARVSLRASFTP
ncbi:lamin tail domain-containing protein [Luteimonas sp. RD2P54]|uniref:Lamin tail domain-containing protein n=1 Tax=Luteimonas endophytica TaxID=3042023 RepID=A0ABT6J8F6_9GAMM|nr:pre-peptidase C-terminal domain-containing protein [Luteimonas endophytica]MDH5823039.1 lamin tail domain-containing protein [Luteimonas endophytica]